MIALKIVDVKKFMAGFLAGNLLDEYRLARGSVTTFCTFSIDGTWHEEFFKKDASSNRSNELSEKLNSASDVQEGKEHAVGAADTPVFTAWKDVRPFCFSIVRGKHTPLAFQFVFYYPEGRAAALLRENDVNPASPSGDSFSSFETLPGLCLNLKFGSGGLFLTTGIARKAFSLDRSVDEAWDQYVKKWLQGLGIEIEVQG